MYVNPLIIVGGIVGTLLAIHAFYGRTLVDKNFKEKADELIVLFGKCRENLQIVTDLDPRFFEKEKVIKKVNELITRNIIVQIIYDPRVGLLDDTPRIRQMIEEGKIDARPYKTNIYSHFMVGDGKHVRLESPHPFRKFEGTGEGRVRFNTLELGRKYRYRFDQMWQSGIT